MFFILFSNWKPAAMKQTREESKNTSKLPSMKTKHTRNLPLRRLIPELWNALKCETFMHKKRQLTTHAHFPRNNNSFQLYFRQRAQFREAILSITIHTLSLLIPRRITRETHEMSEVDLFAVYGRFVSYSCPRVDKNCCLTTVSIRCLLSSFTNKRTNT